MLKPHIMFLQTKGYDVIPAMSGMEALEILKKEFVNIIFLDENMPGLSGLETLQRLKKDYPHILDRRAESPKALSLGHRPRKMFVGNFAL